MEWQHLLVSKKARKGGTEERRDRVTEVMRRRSRRNDKDTEDNSVTCGLPEISV